MNDYEEYKHACQQIKQTNVQLLSEFEHSLQASGLATKTIQKHIGNIDFYINEYLLYEEATAAKDGVLAVDMFLGYWFIKKAMWASQSSIKNNATSLKKFYSFLYAQGLIAKEDLDDLQETIKEGMPEWLATLDRYDDLSVTDVWQ